MIKCNKGDVKIKGNPSAYMAEFMSIVHHLKFEEEVPEEIIRDRVEKALLPMEEAFGILLDEIASLINELKEDEDGE